MNIKKFRKQQKLSDYKGKFSETVNYDFEELATLSQSDFCGILKNNI